MRARWMAVLAAAGVLAAPMVAHAGGWATVELSSTPDGLRPGEPWAVELTVLQHGRTPLEDVTPKIEIAKAGAAGKQIVAATPTERPGVYRAEVTFPSTGRWRYVVDDGFTQRHTYPPVRIAGQAVAAAPPTAQDDGGPPWPALAAGLAAALLAAGLTTALRARRPRPSRAATES